MVGGDEEVRSVDRRVLRAVLDRLTAVEAMAARAGATLSAPLARRHIQTFTVGWRELLSQHQPDPTGRCPLCVGWLRRRRWPCQVWLTAHRHIIGDVTRLIEWPARNSNPFCQPRQVEVKPRLEVIPRQLDGCAAEQVAASSASLEAAPAQRSRQRIDPPNVLRQPPPEVGRWRGR